MSAPIPFKRLILRAVLRNVKPMVIRLVAVPEFLDLADFDDIFNAVLGWDSGIGYAFVQRQLFLRIGDNYFSGSTTITF